MQAIFSLLILTAIILALSIQFILFAYRPDYAALTFNRVINAALGLAGLSLSVVILLAATAFADGGATTAGTTINFGEVVTTLAGLVFAALAAAAHVALRALTAYLKQRTGLETDKAVRAYLDPAIDRAIQYGQTQVEKKAAEGITLNVHNSTVAHAAQYLLAHVPDALGHFGITEDHLADLVEARLGEYLGKYTVLPGTTSLGATSSAQGGAGGTVLTPAKA